MKPFKEAIKKVKSKNANRRHKSFRYTKKRDTERSLNLPGYFKFNHQVMQFLIKNRKLFLSLTIVSSISAFLLFGMASQANYSTIVDTLKASSGDFFEGIGGSIESAGLLFLVAVSGGISQDISEVQQVFTVLVVLMTWLVTVWLSRNILAGNKVKLRDGIYNAGAPIAATLPLAMLGFVQLLPVGIAAFGYSAATATGLLNGGVEAMMFWLAIFCLTLMSLYWLSSTFVALIIITIPGMYPMKALSIARELLFGRRLRIMLRVIWLLMTISLAWIITLLPFIMIDMLIRNVWSGIGSVPIIPIFMLFMSSATIVWFSTYIYLLYRKLVD